GSVFKPVPMQERKPQSAAKSCSYESRSHESCSHESCSHESTRDPKTRIPHRVWPTRYVCGVMTLEEIGRQLRAECTAVGIAQADIVLALTHGGNGLETCPVDTVLAGLARE